MHASVLQTLDDAVNKSKQNSQAWEVLQPQTAISYAWDHPKTGSNLLSLEFAEGSGVKIVDVNVDEVSKSKTFYIMRKMPSLGNPFAEGMLMRREGDTWTSVYCICKVGIMYIFRDESRADLIGVVCLSRYFEATNSNENSTSIGSYAGLELAQAYKYEEKAWDMLTSLGLPMGIFKSSSIHSLVIGNGGSKNACIDVNQVRILLLRIAERLGVYTEGLKLGKQRRRPGDADSNSSKDDSDDNDSVDNASSTDVYDDSFVKKDTLVQKSEVNDISLMSDEQNRSIAEANSEIQSASDILNNRESLSRIDNDAQFLPASTARNFTLPCKLSEMFECGYSVEQLLDILSTTDLNATDIIAAILSLEEAEVFLIAFSTCTYLSKQPFTFVKLFNCVG